MRVFFGITIFMVHTVHHTISPGNQVRRTLEEPGGKVEGPLPKFTGSIHLVRCITVQKERVKKQGKEPVHAEKYQNSCHLEMCKCDDISVQR